WESTRLAPCRNDPCYEKRWLIGNRKIKGRAFVDLTLGPGSAAVPVDDAPHIGQADANAIEFLGPVQALEHAKQLAGILHIETGPVVLDRKLPALLRAAGAANLNAGPAARARVLQGIGDQIDPDLPEHRTV